MTGINPPPLADDPDFRDWAAFVRLRKDAGELHEKRAVEAQKLSSEFSKLIIVNLQFINAGGLLAVPSLATSLFGFTNLTRVEKLYYIGIPMGAFAVGAIAASLCAFCTYLNYSAAAAFFDAQRRAIEFGIEHLNRRLGPEVKSFTDLNLTATESEKVRQNSKIKRYFYASFAAGWVSIACFIGACVFLAFNLRG